MKKIVTFGEVMMRLSPPGHSKFSQTDHLLLTFGGGEANVAISLAYFGLQAVHVTRFPDNYVGECGAQFLRRHWVNTSQVLYGGNEMGIYFLEQGAVHRSSVVVYERSHSAFAKASPDMFDWDSILEDADWFHWTGITPALSANLAQCCLDATATAVKKGIPVSADMAYRQDLWKYGQNPAEILGALAGQSDIVIAGEREMSLLLQKNMQGILFKDRAIALQEAFPSIKKTADKDRISKNASVNTIQGKLWNGKEVIDTQPLEVTHIVDRVGTGDAFAAGLIYGLLQKSNDCEALDFAVSACALKHTIEGDANMVSVKDVDRLAAGDTSGRIIR